MEEEIHEARQEIIDREQRGVVTVIEVMSPTNKTPGARGRESYRQNRREVLDSPSHWVEIDLLRAGVPIVAREHLPPCEYTVHVSRAPRGRRSPVWPIRLTQRLPSIPIPLRPSDPDATLDLQHVLTLAYDRAGYDLDIDYKKEPIPPLPEGLAAWAEELLRGKALR